MSPRVKHEGSVDDCPICNPPPPKKRYTVEELRAAAEKWVKDRAAAAESINVLAFLEHLERMGDES